MPSFLCQHEDDIVREGVVHEGRDELLGGTPSASNSQSG
jgi:hypothetical protein